MKSGNVKSSRFAISSSITAHALTWAVSLWLAFGPVYQGTSATPVGPDGTGGEVTQFSESLIAANGPGALIPMGIPLALTALGLLAVVYWNGGPAGRRVMLWVLAIALLAFCVVGLMSVGLFYLPAALALIVAASLSPGRPNTTVAV